MRRFDPPGSDSEYPEAMGEYISHLDEAVAKHLPESFENARAITDPRHTLMTKLRTEEATFEIPVTAIESVEPAEESGTFLMRFKEEVVGHKGRTALVTGAAVLICAASVHVAKSRRKS